MEGLGVYSRLDRAVAVDLRRMKDGLVFVRSPRCDITEVEFEDVTELCRNGCPFPDGHVCPLKPGSSVACELAMYFQGIKGWRWSMPRLKMCCSPGSSAMQIHRSQA